MCIDSIAFAGGACNTALPPCNADVYPVGGNDLVNVSDLLTIVNHWNETGPPRPQGDCAPLPNGDCVVDVTDLVMVINSFGICLTGPTGSCWLPSNSCAVLTESQCTSSSGLGWVSGATCADSDGDRIPDAYELNTCAATSFPFVGTNPNVADTDGDTIKDGDEFYGTTGGLNLPALGADPLRKNAFLEIDWFDDAGHSHRPTANSINLLVAAFAAAPVANPCGGNGISLIVDYGQGGAYTGGNLIPGSDTVVIFDSEFNTYKAANFASNRNGYFYYSIHCHRYNSASNNSSGISEINGDDHIVSLQTSLSDSNISKTIMHEFGHNLNLRHGGNEDLNYKPNYNSVMNYRYQFPGVDSTCSGFGNGVLDYSHGVRPSLNENSLSESAGVCGSTAIDWNGNGMIDAGIITRNINCSAGSSSACGGSDSSCYDSVCGVLSDFNDWAAVVFTGLNNADLVPPEIVTCDAPREIPQHP